MKHPKALNHMRLIVIVFVIISLFVSLIPIQQVDAAEPNKLFITPATSQMNIGTSFTVNVRSYADTDLPSGSTGGTVTYPAGQLKVKEVTSSGSGYGAPTISLGTGTIGFSGSRNPAPGGSAQIFAITFQAIGAGTATVGFTSNSHVNNSGTSFSSGAYTITNPNPPASSAPKPPPKASVAPPKPSAAPVVSAPSPTPSAVPEVTEPQPTPDPTGLIDGVSVETLYSTATVSWKVNTTNPNATITYGSSSTKLDKSVTPVKKPDGSFEAKLTGLAPGLRYYFAINGSGGGKSGTYSGTVITRGFPIVLTITENKTPVKSAQVKIGNRSYTVSNDGKLSIGLASGNYTGVITTATATLSISLTVEEKPIPVDGSAPPLQTQSFNLTSSVLDQGPGSGSSVLTFIGVLLAGTAILAIGFVGFMAYRRRKYENGSYSNASAQAVIVEDGYDWKNDTPDDTGVESPPSAQYPITPPALSEQTAMPYNSVHITEEEPLDMFDRAADLPLPSNPHNTSGSTSGATGQNPNLPHSTTP